MQRLLVLWLCIFAVAARADDTAKSDEAKLRAAVVQGLGFLDKEGDKWMNDQTCNGCHHMPELIWSHREAKRHGVPIDQKQFDEFVEWSFEKGKYIAAGMETTALLKIALPDKVAPELTKIIVNGQKEDGSWKAAGQLTSQRRGARDATENSARIFLLALGAQETDKDACNDARNKAAAFIAGSEPAKSVDSLLYRTLYARRFGTPEEVEALRTQVLKLQHPDGGWAFIIGEEQGDPLATGQALYILGQTPNASCADAIAQGQNWLLGRQLSNGGWFIDFTRISTVDRSTPNKSASYKKADGIYTYWASAWATIGLEQGLPVVEP